MSRALNVTAAADVVLEKVAILRNPYFAALSEGHISRERFCATQEQFFFAVRYYARPIAALVARIPDPMARLELVHNLVEEHGDLREERFHQNTFRKFLASIGGRSPDAAGVRMSPAVHAFNSVLMGACASDELDVGVCCLGIIERAFARVSALIGKVVVERRWVSADKLIHYSLHAELDIRHAEDFFAIVEERYANQRGKDLIEQGLELGAYAFDRLYRDLYQDTGGIDG